MQTLKVKLQSKLESAKKIAVLGVGSELMGDDQAGIIVAKGLASGLKKDKINQRVKVFLGHTAPENVTGEIKRFKPTHLIIIDTAHFGKKAGSVALFDSNNVEGISFSTHRLPVNIISDYLYQSIGCKVIIIGIQLKKIKFSFEISKPVKKTIKELINLLKDIFKHLIR